ncbi:MAG TPA: hypothetical protein VG992_00060 [Candidatus Saccharimonadales bacterium]|nr:hypothetical protein [Candidatus Saccharimonadales bacterium]
MSGPALPEKFLYRDSGDLEALAHSQAFDMLTDDYAVERRTVARCGDLRMEADLIPPEMAEIHAFPGIFNVSGFSAELRSLPASEDDQPADWLFSANYSINGEDYALSAQPDSTSLRTSSYAGSELVYRFDSTMASRFLSAMALQAVQVGTAFIRLDADWRDPQAAPQHLDQLMHLLGESSGVYEGTRVAFLPVPEQDRGVLIRHMERETPRTSGMTVDYKMAWRIGGSLLCGLNSCQREVARHDGQEPMEIRYSERCHGRCEPEDLILDDLFGDDEESAVFNPTDNHLEYARVNTAIMRTLHYYLRQPRYAQADRIFEI